MAPTKAGSNQSVSRKEGLGRLVRSAPNPREPLMRTNIQSPQDNAVQGLAGGGWGGWLLTGWVRRHAPQLQESRHVPQEEVDVGQNKQPAAVAIILLGDIFRREDSHFAWADRVLLLGVRLQAHGHCQQCRCRVTWPVAGFILITVGCHMSCWAGLLTLSAKCMRLPLLSF